MMLNKKRERKLPWDKYGLINILYPHCFSNMARYNSFLVYCRELAPASVSLTGDCAQGDDSKHDSHYTCIGVHYIICGYIKDQ